MGRIDGLDVAWSRLRRLAMLVATCWAWPSAACSPEPEEVTSCDVRTYVREVSVESSSAPDGSETLITGRMRDADRARLLGSCGGTWVELEGRDYYSRPPARFASMRYPDDFHPKWSTRNDTDPVLHGSLLFCVGQTLRPSTYVDIVLMAVTY